MLTESEILDEQVQTLDEALDKLDNHEDEVVTPATAPDVDAGQALHVTVECLKATVDLYRTISAEGVSADDVKALRSIRERMKPYMTLQVRPALEAYEGMFTPGRSMINQTVSMEASLAEAGITLKEWFFKFVDFIIRVVEWCRIAWNSETAAKFRLGMIDSNLQSMYNAFNDAYKRNLAAGRDNGPELNEIARMVLTDPKLNRNEAMLTAMGDMNYEMRLALASRNLSRAFEKTMKDVASLKDHIERNKPMVMSTDHGSFYTDIVAEFDDMLVNSPDVDYLVDKLGLDFWKDPKTLLNRKVYPPSEHIRQVQEMGKEFRAIKRNINFDNLKNIDEVVVAVENLTTCIKCLEKAVTFKQELFMSYYKASATLANFYIRGQAILQRQLDENASDDQERAVNAALNKSWQAILKKMGM